MARAASKNLPRAARTHLERELGLGSLERVELMLRLGNTCGVRLPDRVVAEADTVQDLIDAILRENPAGTARSVAPGTRQERPHQFRAACALASQHLPTSKNKSEKLKRSPKSSGSEGAPSQVARTS